MEPTLLMIVGGAAGLAALEKSVNPTGAPRGSSNSEEDIRLTASWIWPMPRLRDGRLPAISDGWGSKRDGGRRQHAGIDIMYRRKAPVGPPFDDGGSKWYEVPGDVPILAAGPGKIWSAGKTATGWSVVIDHGKPFATYYTHMRELRGDLAKGKIVDAGHVLGICGASPLDAAKIKHLHFAVWKNGAGDKAAIDPGLLTGRWRVLGAL